MVSLTALKVECLTGHLIGYRLWLRLVVHSFVYCLIGRRFVRLASDRSIPGLFTPSVVEANKRK